MYIYMYINIIFATNMVQTPNRKGPCKRWVLHTPNFAAFWPKPRKKQILGQCAAIMQTVLHLTPPLQMSGSCPKPKKTSRNRKILGQCAGIMQTVLHLTPPCRCQAPVQKPKKHREIERFCPKPKRTREIEKKKPKDSGTMCWYHVNILLARLDFLFFSISRGFFRFWTKSFDFSMFFLILDGFFRILNVFLILDTFF